MVKKSINLSKQEVINVHHSVLYLLYQKTHFYTSDAIIIELIPEVCLTFSVYEKHEIQPLYSIKYMPYLKLWLNGTFASLRVSFLELWTKLEVFPITLYMLLTCCFAGSIFCINRLGQLSDLKLCFIGAIIECNMHSTQKPLRKC